MGLGIAIAGGIICATVLAVFSIVFSTSGQIYEINSSRTNNANLASTLSQTDIDILHLFAPSRNNTLSLTLNNTGNEKLWDYEKFAIIVTYNASIGDVPTLTRERLTYNSAQAFAQRGADATYQASRPDEDVSKGGWTDVAGGDNDLVLYDEVREITKNDANYTSSLTLTVNGQTDIWKSGISSVIDPVSSSNHNVTYSYRKSCAVCAGSVLALTVKLLQGSTEIWSQTHADIGSSFTETTATLSAAQADSITNYSDLYLQFTAEYTVGADSANADVSWAKLEVPPDSVYNCSAVNISSGEWTIDRISNDLQDPKILNINEGGKFCLKLSNVVHPNSNVVVTISTDLGKVNSDTFKS